MTSFWEWLGRVVMLVLAGMITLSIIGAIASIPSGSIETRLGVEPQGWPEPRPSERAPVPQQPEPARPQAASPLEPSGQAAPGTATVPRPPDPPTPAQWLESIAYALLAIAGLLALGIALLLRALSHWRRSADALEAIALSRGR